MNNLVIWDREEDPPSTCSSLAFWARFVPSDAPDSWVSLPALTLDRKSLIRSSYHDWVSSSRDRLKPSSSLQRFLRIRPNLNYWWMLLPSEVAIEPDSIPYQVSRIIALNQLCSENQISTVHLETQNRDALRVLKSWSKITGITLSTSLQKGSSSRKLRKHELVQKVCRVAPFLLALRVLLGAIGAVRFKRPDDRTNSLIFVDYLAHLDLDAAARGTFSSKYWGALVARLSGTVEGVEWLHMPANPLRRTNAHVDRAVVAGIMQDGGGDDHTLVADFLSTTVILRALKTYLHLVRAGLRFTFDSLNDQQAKIPGRTIAGGAVRDGFFGASAMANSLNICLLEAKLNSSSAVSQGFYLMENQPWEFALIAAWKRKGSARLIGVAHASVNYWDTRIFRAPEDLWSPDADAMPCPDLVAANGPLMQRELIESGYPAKRIVQVEALRFLELVDHRPPQEVPDKARVLVVGEYSPNLTQRMVSAIEGATKDLPLTLTFRPHPLCTQGDTNMIFIQSDEPLREALAQANYVICGPYSSVSVAAIATGSRVIIFEDPRAFATSPTDGLPGSIHARHSLEVRSALQNSRGEPEAPDPLNLGKDLEAWMTLIQNVDNYTPN